MPLLVCRYAEVAQLAEHSPEKAGVDSSILSLGTIFPLLTPLAPEEGFLPPQAESPPHEDANPNHGCISHQSGEADGREVIQSRHRRFLPSSNHVVLSGDSDGGAN